MPQFTTNARIHIGLAVSNIQQSTAFYQALLNSVPNKTRDNYARFEVNDPPAILSLIESDRPNALALPSHFGVQLKTIAEVNEVAERLKSAGLSINVEESTECCYATQTKVWATDPDGNSWETYVVTNDDPQSNRPEDCCSEPSSAEDNVCCEINGVPCCSS